MAAGVITGLRDRFHLPHAPQISDEAKAWVIDLACRKPKSLGLAAELSTLLALAAHTASHAAAAGFPRLSSAGESTIWRILDAHELKPHRVRYYGERRDAQFERKMAEVLMVYRVVDLYRAEPVHDTRPLPVYTGSVDEKPGVQALGTTARDLPPVSGKHPDTGRDYEYVRHGSLSILAALDLDTGQIIATSNCATAAWSSSRCCGGSTSTIVRIPLSASYWTTTARTSPRTLWRIWQAGRAASSTSTPQKHGSWLNLVEPAFSKMARSFLRQIRMALLDELKLRILKGIDEMNAHPVRLRWKNFDVRMV